MAAKGVPLIQEVPAIVRAFETRRLRPGNRRMATLAGAYSVDRHSRTPQHVVERQREAFSRQRLLMILKGGCRWRTGGC
jgi:hypothetical protein